jgi:AraC-like DNA-binding protein
VLTILGVLNRVAVSGEFRILSGPGFTDANHANGSERINKVFDYILQNFTNVIKLEEIAGLVSLTPTSFCRYFKQHTQKPFSRYLNEVRISYACKLLLEKSFSITRIGYESGFQNLSNFNRQFKKIKGMTPRDYQLSGS